MNEQQPQPEPTNSSDQSYFLFKTAYPSGTSPVLNLVCLTQEQLEEYVKSRKEQMRERS